MIYRLEQPQPCDEELAAIRKEIRVRVLNCSATGCLIETTGPIAVGTVAELAVAFGGKEFADTVQVVRCHEIRGAGVHHVGAQFLATTPPYVGTLRYAMHRELGKLSGWLRTDDV